mmetsp:Transcript_52742/g.138685  ORF Transcript_52742/g.138685 Transcript_52742/m.138685 type:complete len:320 (-) Transcript_52742:3946-4905(-)
MVLARVPCAPSDRLSQRRPPPPALSAAWGSSRPLSGRRHARAAPLGPPPAPQAPPRPPSASLRPSSWRCPWCCRQRPRPSSTAPCGRRWSPPWLARWACQPLRSLPRGLPPRGCWCGGWASGPPPPPSPSPWRLTPRARSTSRRARCRTSRRQSTRSWPAAACRLLATSRCQTARAPRPAARAASRLARVSVSLLAPRAGEVGLCWLSSAWFASFGPSVCAAGVRARTEPTRPTSRQQNWSLSTPAPPGRPPSPQISFSTGRRLGMGVVTQARPPRRHWSPLSRPLLQSRRASPTKTGRRKPSQLNLPRQALLKALPRA